MSPLARLLAARGERVRGSDRAYDAGRNANFFRRLVAEGVELVPQDGRGVTPEIRSFVVTRAVEESIPDICRARELGVPIVKRPALVAEVFRGGRSIAVGGTSGKSTTTGMIGWALNQLGHHPTIMNGAEMVDFQSNFVAGGELSVFEADESDGLKDVVGLCQPSVAVVTNISLDHFGLSELEEIFAAFVMRATVGAVLNADCPISRRLVPRARRTITFGLASPADVTVRDLPRQLAVPGEHNVANALAALAALRLLGVTEHRAAEAIAAFGGMRRRLELVATAGGIRVYDDFASNPGKIEATLATVRLGARRIVVVFQPHGFQPTKLMLSGYIDVFSRLLQPGDLLIIPPIYYAGGTANVVEGEVVALPTDVSGEDIVRGVVARSRTARYVPQRDAAFEIVRAYVEPGDVVISMGSRDETLPDFARALAESIGRGRAPAGKIP